MMIKYINDRNAACLDSDFFFLISLSVVSDGAGIEPASVCPQYG